MIKKLHTLCLGLLTIVSAGSLSAYGGCYDYCSQDCGTFGLKAEYLYWQTQICDQDYAREFRAELGDYDKPISVLDDCVHRMGHQWRSGFRLGADYQCSFEDPWRYSLVYTYYRSRNSACREREEKCEDLGQKNFLVPTIPIKTRCGHGHGYEPEGRRSNDDLINLDKAKSHTRFRLDLGDFEIIRTTPLCGPANFNILLGIRGGYLRNDWEVSYFPERRQHSWTEGEETDSSEIMNANGSGNGNGHGSNTCTHVTNDWRYSAIGPRVGGQFDWCLGCGFKIYIDASLTALWGKIRNRIHSFIDEVEENGCESASCNGNGSGSSPCQKTHLCVLEDLHRRCYKAVLMANGEAGVAYDWCCESFIVQAKLGVELVHFNSLADNTYRKPFSGDTFGRRDGNVDLYGLTMGLGIMF